MTTPHPTTPTRPTRLVRTVVATLALALVAFVAIIGADATTADAATTTSEECQVHNDGITHCEVTSCYTELGGNNIDCVTGSYCMNGSQVQSCGGNSNANASTGEFELSVRADSGDAHLDYVAIKVVTPQEQVVKTR